jgi:hypothetical protein
VIRGRNKISSVIGLIINPPDTIEGRVAKIIRYIVKEYADLTVIIKDLEATGPIGRSLPQQFESNELSSIIELFEENGQVIELGMIIQNNDIAIELIIRDNSHADILTSSVDILPKEITGNYIQLDPSVYRLT